MPSSIAVLSPDSRPCLLFALLSVQLVMLKTRKFPLAMYHLLFTSLLEFCFMLCISFKSLCTSFSCCCFWPLIIFLYLCCLHVHCKVLLSINMWEEKITICASIYLIWHMLLFLSPMYIWWFWRQNWERQECNSLNLRCSILSPIDLPAYV